MSQPMATAPAMTISVDSVKVHATMPQTNPAMVPRTPFNQGVIVPPSEKPRTTDSGKASYGRSI